MFRKCEKEEQKRTREREKEKGKGPCMLFYVSTYHLYIVVYIINDNICIAPKGKWMRLLMYKGNQFEGTGHPKG